MKFLNEVPFLKIGIVLFVMPASQAFAIEPNQVYLAQASAWQCRLTWAGGGTTLGQGGTKDAALQDLNRQVSLDRVNNNGQNYSVGTTCYTLPVPGGASSNPSTGSNSSPRPQPRVGYFDDGGTVFYSNGTSYCGFVSPKHFDFYKQVNQAPTLGRQSPSIAVAS